MNRHERRKARVFERKMVPFGELNRMGSLCAWDGCAAHFQGEMPKGWVWLVTYWHKRPSFQLLEVPQSDMPRDAVLCPKHNAQLEALLKPLGRELDTPAAGNA